MNTVERILQLIHEKGINEKTFLDDIGINKSSLWNWKGNITVSYLKYIIQIAKYLNVTTDYLLCLSDNPKPIEGYKLTEDQIRLNDMYSLLTDMEKGEILGRLNSMVELKNKGEIKIE